MPFLYTFFIYIYWFGMRFAALFHKKAALWVKGRLSLFSELERNKEKVAQSIWFHVASLGEFEQARPIIEKIKKENPAQKILVSFFSPSGYEIRKKYPLADYVCYLPIDTQNAVKHFLDIVKPTAVVIVKYEFWRNLIEEIYTRNIPLFLVCARFRKEQYFFSTYISFFRKILTRFSKILVLDTNSKMLLESISISSEISPDTRFDRVFEICNQQKNFPVLETYTASKKTIVCGSTWQEDEEKLAEVYHAFPEVQFIIAPHDVNENSIRRIQQRFKDSVLFSEIVEKDELISQRVIIIDSIGNLASLYKYGLIAYIGGGFGRSIHNILEAAVYGIPVVFGSNYKSTVEAVELIEKKGVFSFDTSSELKNRLDKLLTNDTERMEAGFICKNYVTERLGGTLKVLELLEPILEK